MADKQVYFSYRRTDTPFAQKLVADLESTGIDTWIDYKDIAAGQDWMQAMRGGLNESDAVIVLLSQDSIANSFWLPREIYAAFCLEKTIFPIIIDPNVRLPLNPTHPLADLLKGLHIVDFTPNYPAALDRLVAAIKNVKVQKTGGYGSKSSMSFLQFMIRLFAGFLLAAAVFVVLDPLDIEPVKLLAAVVITITAFAVADLISGRDALQAFLQIIRGIRPGGSGSSAP